MNDFLFFLKTFALTVAIVFVMQIQVGQKSLERHAMGWVQSSAVAEPLNNVAKGAAKLARDAKNSIYKYLGKDKPRHSNKSSESP